MIEYIKIPVIEEMDYRAMNVFEHPPLSYFRYGEYPRYISPIGAHPPRVKIVRIKHE